MPRHYHRQPYEQQAAQEHHAKRAPLPEQRPSERVRIRVRFDARTTGTIWADALDRWREKYPDLIIL